jgi:23S rRNA (uracil1939-C5)-methyltransferase
VRRSAGTGEAHVILVATRGAVPGLAGIAAELRERGATSVSLNVHDGPPGVPLGRRTVTLSGPQRIRERIAGTDYLLSATSFFQTAPFGAAAVIQQVMGGLAPEPGDTVADLYCGVGLLTLPLARAVRTVLGVEISAAAIADAAAAARLHGATNVELVAARVEDSMARLRQLAQPLKVVIDPPRSGCAPIIAALAALKPERIAYVSCDERALARDLRGFHAAGYSAREVTPIDMFPHTSHLESVTLLESR